jgi:hypothetical protein
LLVVERTGIRMTAHAEMRARPALILISDVALAHIAGHDEDLDRCVKLPCLAPSHDSE